MPLLPGLAVALLPALAFVPPPPADDVHVVDTTGTMTAAGVEAAEAAADEWAARTTNDVVVAVVPTLDGLTVEAYTAELLAGWQPGVPGVGNGVAVVVAVDDQQLRVEAGPGLIEELPVERAGELATALRPQLDAGDLDGAVLGLVTGVVQVVDAAAADPGPTTTTPFTFDPEGFAVEDADRGGLSGWVGLGLLAAVGAALYRRFGGGGGSDWAAARDGGGWGSGTRRRRFRGRGAGRRW